VSLNGLLDGMPRVVISFLVRSAYVPNQDRAFCSVILPGMVWEKAEQAVALLEERGAVEQGGAFVIDTIHCEAVGSSLSKAGFLVICDPNCLAESRAARRRALGLTDKN
jgi:hypothetical protein